MFNRKVKIAAFLVAFLGLISPACAQLWYWSVTATNNANVDATINWAEGQPPSSVNDSARAMMARVAQFRNDISGQNVDTGGSGSAYVVATSSGSTATPSNGQVLAFTPAHTNLAGVTLQVDGGSVFPIQAPISIGIPSGIMLANQPYSLVFDSSTSSWILQGVVGSGTQYLTSPFSTLSTSLANVTGFGFTLISGQTYSFKTDLWVTGQQSSAAGIQLAFQCTCTASAFINSAEMYDTAIFSIEGGTNTHLSTPAVLNSSTTTTGAVHVTAEGTITASSNGTFTLQIAQEGASGTALVAGVGSTMRVWQ
jgi:hypothetical protein